MNRLLLIALILSPALASATPKKKAKPKAKKPVPTKPAPEPEPEIEMAPDPAPPRPPAPEPAPALAPAPKAEATVDVDVKVAIKVKKPKFYVRAGVAQVTPLAQSRPLELADVDGAASLAIQNGPIAGSGSSVSSATIPAIIVGYVLPFGRDRLSVETVLGMPFTVKFRATGTLANESIAPMALGIPTGVPALGPELGEAKAAPPTLTLVYQLRNQGTFRPFIGAGLAVLFAYDAHVTNPILTEVSDPPMSIAPAPGLVLQTGAEARLSKRFYARLDVKFIAFMMAHARVEHIQVKTPELPVFDNVEVGTAKMDVWVNPLIVQAGIGMDF